MMDQVDLDKFLASQLTQAWLLGPFMGANQGMEDLLPHSL